MPPIALVPVDLAIASSYQKSGGTGGSRDTLIPLAKLGKAGVAHPKTAEALLALHHAVMGHGGDLRITELHRDVAVQKLARSKYDNWVKAGKPPASSPAFDAKNMKAAFVATPGRSGHNAGRSIDIDLASQFAADLGLRVNFVDTSFGAFMDELVEDVEILAAPRGITRRGSKVRGRCDRPRSASRYRRRAPARRPGTGVCKPVGSTDGVGHRDCGAGLARCAC